jgi:4-hydroxy-4-methyl-2-oxoglutarate aldolase
MPTILRTSIARCMSEGEVAPWKQIPTTVIADELNRAGGMLAAIRPIGSHECFAGEAVTVQTLVGDNGALHWAVNHMPAGCVLVVDAGAFMGTAVWGEILHTVAERRGVAGVIVDGVVRDRAALRRSAVPICARGSVPNGPHKGWGGCINGDIQCGGVKVGPNDLIVSDADGIVVVPRDEIVGLLGRCRVRMQYEVALLGKISAGESTVDLLGLSGPSAPPRSASAP